MRSPHGIGTGHLRAMSVRWQNAGADAKSLICRVSSAVEQRFCKPLVGSSILSPGTAFPPGPRGHPWAIEGREPSQVAIQAQFRRLTARRWQVGKASGTGVPS